MATSGVPVNQECLTTYQDLKLKKTHKFIIFKLNDQLNEIVVDKCSKETDYEAFLGELPGDAPRWAVYDFEFEKPGAGKRNKLTFYSWNPDGAKIKQKMVYASSRDTLRKALVGIAAEIQGTDTEEVSHATVLDRVSRGA